MVSSVRRTLVTTVVTGVLLVALAAPAMAGGDRAAQSRLRNGFVTALVFYTDDDTYLGFDAAEAHSIEPTLTFVDGTEPVGKQVDVQIVEDQRFMMVALSRDGTFFSMCRGEGGRTRYGFGRSFARVDEMEDCRFRGWAR